MSVKDYEVWIEKKIAIHEGVFGVQVKLELPAELTVSCNLYRTTKENALACYRAIEGVLGSEAWWGDTVNVSLFRSHGASNVH